MIHAESLGSSAFMLIAAAVSMAKGSAQPLLNGSSTLQRATKLVLVYNSPSNERELCFGHSESRI